METNILPLRNERASYEADPNVGVWIVNCQWQVGLDANKYLDTEEQTRFI